MQETLGQPQHGKKQTQTKIGNLNARPETMKLLQENIVKMFQDIEMGKDFWRSS